MTTISGRRRWLALVVLVAFAVAGAVAARSWIHGLSFVVRAADMHGVLRRAADLDAGSVREREIRVPVTAGTVRARAYEPAGTIRRTALVVGGLHPGGCDEPRLVAFSRQLAASGVAAITPSIPELSQFSITPALTDSIEQVAIWLAADPTWAPDGRIGMMGVSFSGGLTVVAAGRPSLRGHVAYVFSFGGHDDLPRVLRYLVAGSKHGRAPNDYGVAIVLLGVADRLVPPEQIGTLREAVTRYLGASYTARADRPRADREFADLRATARRLPESSATLLQYVNDRDVERLGQRLLPYIAFYGAAPALSVSRSPKPAAPAFLLHGLEDNVIPADESVALAGDLSTSGARVRLLLTDLVSHAEADQPPQVWDVLKLAAFWGDLLER